MSNNFSESGYLILKNAIKKQLVQKIQNEIYNCIRISGKNKKLKYFKFCKKVSNLKSKNLILPSQYLNYFTTKVFRKYFFRKKSL